MGIRSEFVVWHASVVYFGKLPALKVCMAERGALTRCSWCRRRKYDLGPEVSFPWHGIEFDVVVCLIWSSRLSGLLGSIGGTGGSRPWLLVWHEICRPQQQ